MPTKKEMLVDAIKYRRARQVQMNASKGKRPYVGEEELSNPVKSSMRKASVAYGKKGYPKSIDAASGGDKGFAWVDVQKKKKKK